MSKSSKTGLTGFRERKALFQPPQEVPMVTLSDCLDMVTSYRHNVQTLTTLLENYVDRGQEVEAETVGHTGRMLLVELEKIDTWLGRLLEIHHRGEQ